MRFTIARKLGLGFGILMVAFAVNVILTLMTLDKSRDVNERITTVYTPSLEYLNELYEMITNSKLLIKNWVFIDQSPATPDKIKLIELHQEKFPRLQDTLLEISKEWEPKQRESMKQIFGTIKDTLFVYHKMVMEMLNSFESYDDPMVMFEVEPMAQEGGEIMVYTDEILTKLSQLIEVQNQIVNRARGNMVQSFQDLQRTIGYMGFFLMLAVLAIALITTRALVKPINYMKGVLLSMSRGVLPEKTIRQSNDEIGEMAVAMNGLINGLKQIQDFAIAIGKGNFDKNFNPLSDEDRLGFSLMDMRDNLKQASLEEDKRKIEDKQRAWASNGIAKFSDILRNNNDDINNLAYDVISQLVKYLEINQGGLFIIDDSDPEDVFVEMKACYAYDRRKHLEKKFELGVGLVGRCIQEKEVVYVTEVPEDYMNITSGLGEEKPGCVLIVPMILNDEVFGVIELTAFHEIEQYKIDFVKRLGESIASTIAAVKTNMRTSYLLEKTQKQAEEMSQQEEEMRQNMEELQATQEESSRREEQYKKEIEELRQKLKQKN